MASHIGPQHLARVRFLYKSILRLHSGLPPELRALGDLYVKEEFRKHKTAEANFIGPFMNEWTVSKSTGHPQSLSDSTTTILYAYTILILIGASTLISAPTPSPPLSRENKITLLLHISFNIPPGK